MATSFSSTLTNNSNTLFTWGSLSLPDDAYDSIVNTLTNTTVSDVYTLTVDSNDTTIPEFGVEVYQLQTNLAAIGLTTWNDGVWAMSVSFHTDGTDTDYVSQAYCLSMYDIDCGITKFAAKMGCNKRAQAKMGLMLSIRSSINLLFTAQDFAQCNTLILQLQSLLTNEGCGCGC